MLRPMGDRVLVKPDEISHETDSGLILPETASEVETSGVVVAVGPGGGEDCPHCGKHTRPAMTVQVGDYVAFSWKDGAELTIDDERFILLKQGDIQAIVETEGA